MSTIKTTFIQHPSAVSPAIELSADGSILLPLSGIGDLADVDEGSGAVDGDVLTYDGTGDVWVPQGLVLPAAIGSNVVTVNKVDAFTTTSTTFVDITGMTASITPTTNTSKVLIVCQLSVGGRNDQRMYVNLMRGATNLNQSTGGTDNATISMGTFPNESGIIPVIISFLDSPATTSSTTYKLQIRTTGSSCTVNRSRLDTTAGSTSSITLVEVAA